MRHTPILAIRKRIAEIKKSFPREVEYGDALTPSEWDENCVFNVSVDAREGSITVEDYHTGEKWKLSATEALQLGVSLVRAAKILDRQ